MADRLVGSPEIYGHEEREAEQSVNFVTCHDGFTLNDLVSYDRKHNEANGEDNRDGANDNRSWNCGVEGASHDPATEKLRNRQVKNFLTVTLLSLGMPMLLMGDEVRRSQNGNNNAYCQDNEISWLSWNLVNEHADLLRFTRLLISRRLSRDVSAELERKSLNRLIHGANKYWHGVKPYQPDWSDHSHSLALSAEIRQERLLVYLILNAYWEPLNFELPLLENSAYNKWHRWIDTYLDSPEDIVNWKAAATITAHIYTVGPRSVVVLYTQDESGV
jgi:glycogen operon protein